MRAEIDLTEDDPGISPGDGNLPQPSIISDDGDILIQFSDVVIRVSYSQFDRILESMNAWRNAIGPEEPFNL